MRNVIASLVGRGLSDWEIRHIVGPHCTQGFDDPDLTPLLQGGREKWGRSNPDRASESEAPSGTDLTAEDRLEQYRFAWWEDLKTQQQVDWLIENFLPQAGFVVLYGKPGSFKSFIAMSMATFIAAGRDWTGRRVKAGPVLYIAAEGQAGLGLRREAIIKTFDLPNSLPLGFVRTQVDLCSRNAETDQIVALIGETLPDPVLIVIDTLSRALAGGDENSPRDMGGFIVNVGKLMAETGAAVFAIHHCGKDEARGMRGHSSLLGAVDTEMEIIRPSQENLAATVTITKQKDGEDGLTFDVRMETVALLVGEGVHAREVSTLVAVPSDDVRRKRPEHHRKQQPYALELLKRAIEEEGGPVPGQASSVRGITITLWQAYCRTYHLSPANNEDAQRMAFGRAMKGLQQAGSITTKASYVWIN
jgi:hypothetical protein